MKKAEQRRIVRELCGGLKEQLLLNVRQFPDYWDGHEIRALAAFLVETRFAGTASRPYKRTLARMRRDTTWLALPL